MLTDFVSDLECSGRQFVICLGLIEPVKDYAREFSLAALVGHDGGGSSLFWRNRNRGSNTRIRGEAGSRSASAS